MTNVSHLNVSLDGTLAEAFPDVDPGLEPFGSRVIVQMRTAKGRTKGGIILTSSDRDTEQWNTQTAKVIAIGGLAFCDRRTGTPWPEGPWFKVGDFIRVPKYTGDKWQVPIPGIKDEFALFAMFNETDCLGRVTGDPLAFRAFV